MQTTVKQYDEHIDQRKRILKLLRDNDFVPTAQLRLIAYQYNARIYELRKKGYVIKSVKTPKCGFMLIGKLIEG